MDVHGDLCAHKDRSDQVSRAHVVHTHTHTHIHLTGGHNMVSSIPNNIFTTIYFQVTISI